MALVNLQARSAPAGQTTVVLAPAGRHFAARGDRSRSGGRFQRKGSSAFAGRIGKARGRPRVTVVDDGTVPGRRGSLAIDDEGNSTSRTVLIEDGILWRLHAGFAHAPSG